MLTIICDVLTGMLSALDAPYICLCCAPHVVFTHPLQHFTALVHSRARFFICELHAPPSKYSPYTCQPQQSIHATKGAPSSADWCHCHNYKCGDSNTNQPLFSCFCHMPTHAYALAIYLSIYLCNPSPHQPLPIPTCLYCCSASVQLTCISPWHPLVFACNAPCFMLPISCSLFPVGCHLHVFVITQLLLHICLALKPTAPLA